MSYCKLCGKSEDETEIFKGIYDNRIVEVCKDCADEESIPLIKKPSQEQLEVADKSSSVRERMERLSGLSKQRGLTQSQLAASRSLAKLRMPLKKQYDPKLVDNYDWDLRMARRRKKITLSQLSVQTGVPIGNLEDLEAGQIPQGFEDIVEKLERYFNIKLLTEQRTKIHFTRQHGDNEKKLLAEVEMKLKNPVEKEVSDEEKKKKMKDLSEGKVDLSKRKDLENVTLRDLQEAHLAKLRAQEKRVAQQQHESMFGEDLDIEDL